MRSVARALRMGAILLNWLFMKALRAIMSVYPSLLGRFMATTLAATTPSRWLSLSSAYSIGLMLRRSSNDLLHWFYSGDWLL